MRELDGRVAIVTGGARNIGRAIVLALAEGGAAVVVNARSDRAAAEAVADEARAGGGRAVAALADVSDESAAASLVAAGIAAFGRLDIVVNNAAVRRETPLAELTFAEWREVLAVTLDGPFLLARAALPHLIASGQGAIVNIGGLSAYTGARNRAHVIAAKAGLDGLTRALAHELGSHGITVNTVAPGLIDTARGRHSPASPDHHKRNHTLLGRRGTPAEVASWVRRLAGPDGRYITGQAEASPWQMHELEVMLRDFAGDVPPFGLEAPSLRKMVAAICAEQHAQKLVPTAARSDDLFAWFEATRRGA